MRKAKLSFQTPGQATFRYNPFAGANINVFPSDRGDKPRTFILETNYLEPNKATALYGRLIVSINATSKQISVTLLCRDGIRRPLQRFSIVYASKAKKQRFAAY